MNGNMNGTAMGRIVVTGGTLLDQTGERTGDVAIENGRISAVGADVVAGATDTVLDATGCIVSPGKDDVCG